MLENLVALIFNMLIYFTAQGDPDTVNITYVEAGTIKSLWAKRSDTISTLKSRLKGLEAESYGFSLMPFQEQKLYDGTIVSSLLNC